MGNSGGNNGALRDGVAIDGARPVEIDDITFVGGGPVGLFGAFYAGLRGVRTRIIESLEQLGGQLSAIYPEKYIYDVAGFPKVRAKDLVRQLEEQAMQYNPAVVLGTQVVGLERRAEDGRIVLRTTKGVFLSRAVVITAGIGAFTPKTLPAPGVAEFEGRGVCYWVGDLQSFAGKRVLVIGGGDSAVDFALMLQPVAEHVTLIHRRDGFRAHESSVKQLYESGVEVLVFHELKQVEGGDRLTRATIFHNKTRQERTLDVDRVVLALGFTPDLGPIRQWGLEIEDDGIRVRNFKMETGIPGIYAAGDIATYPGKLKLIATGFGEVATAVNNARTFIDPSAALFPGHSSSRKE